MFTKSKLKYLAYDFLPLDDGTDFTIIDPGPSSYNPNHPGDNGFDDSFQDLFVTNIIPQETFAVRHAAGIAPVPGWSNIDGS